MFLLPTDNSLYDNIYAAKIARMMTLNLIIREINEPYAIVKAKCRKVGSTTEK